MNTKKKVAITVGVLIAVALIVGGAILINVAMDFPYVQKGWALAGIGYEDAKTVFGEDSLFVDHSFFNEINFESSLFQINFNGRNKTLKDGVISGYEEKAVSYGVSYQGKHSVDENIILTIANIVYNKTADSERIKSATKEYSKYKYCSDSSEKGNMILTVIKNGQSLEVIMFFENNDGNKDIQLDDQFVETYSKFIMDKII